MKKIMKSRIFLVIITMIICISGTLYAAVTYKATDVVYNANDGTSKNVSEALNELYENCSITKIYPKVTITTEADTVIGQTVIATLIKDKDGNSPKEEYVVKGTLTNSTTLVLKKIGTYKITASSSDGLENYSDEITVQYDNVYNINYTVKKYLFNNSDVTAVTGGWGVMWEASGGTPGASTSGGTVNSTLYLTSGSSGKKDMYAKNSIDLTGWKRIVIVCTYYNNLNNGWAWLHLYQPGGYWSKDAKLVVGDLGAFSVGTFTYDISSSKYQKEVRFALLAARVEWKISKIYLEK